MDWSNVYEENVEMPWHLWDDVRERCPEYDIDLTDDVVERVLSESLPDGCIMWDFWQQQNTWIEMSEVRSVMFDALVLSGYHIDAPFPFIRWKVLPDEASLVRDVDGDCLTILNGSSDPLLSLSSCMSRQSTTPIIMKHSKLMVY